MKIAFSGASGTGKSVLVNFLWHAYKAKFPDKLGPVVIYIGARYTAYKMGFRYWSEAAQVYEGLPYLVDEADLETYLEIKSRGLSTPHLAAERAIEAGRAKDTDFISCRGLFQETLAEEKIKVELATPIFLAERSSLDDATYALQHCPQIVTEQFLERAIRHTLRYDLVFFCPISAFQNLGNDPARNPNLEYHLQTEAILLDLHKKCNHPNLIVLNEGDLEKRKEQVEKAFLLSQNLGLFEEP